MHASIACRVTESAECETERARARAEATSASMSGFMAGFVPRRMSRHGQAVSQESHGTLHAQSRHGESGFSGPGSTLRPAPSR